MGTKRTNRAIGFSIAMLTLLSGLQLGFIAELAQAGPIPVASTDVPQAITPTIPGGSTDTDAATDLEALAARALPASFLDAFEVTRLDASLKSALDRYANAMNVPVRNLPLRDVSKTGALPAALSEFAAVLAPDTEPAHLLEAQSAAAVLPDDLQFALARLLYAMVDGADLQMQAVGALTPFEIQAFREDALDTASLAEIASKVDFSKSLDAARLIDNAVAQAEPVLKKWGLLTDIHRKIEGRGISDASILAASLDIVSVKTPADVFRWTATLRGFEVPEISNDLIAQFASVPPSAAIAALYRVSGTPIGASEALGLMAANELTPNLAKATSVLVLASAVSQILLTTDTTADPGFTAEFSRLAPSVADVALSSSTPSSTDLDTLRAFNGLLGSSGTNGNALAAAALILAAAEAAEAFTLDLPGKDDLRPMQATSHDDSRNRATRLAGVEVVTYEHPGNHTTQVTVRVPLLGVNMTYYSPDKVVYDDDGRCRLRVWRDRDGDGFVDDEEKTFRAAEPSFDPNRVNESYKPQDNQLPYLEFQSSCDRANGVLYHDPYFYVMILDDGSSVIDSRYGATEDDKLSGSRPLRDAILGGWNQTLGAESPFGDIGGDGFSPFGLDSCDIDLLFFGDTCALGGGGGPNPGYIVPAGNVTLNRESFQIVLLDLGGDDTYKNNVGGTYNHTSNGDRFRSFPVAVHLDLGGDDTYATTRAYTLGAADAGLGILIDRDGNDKYTARSRSIGVGNFSFAPAQFNFGGPQRCASGGFFTSCAVGMGLFFDLAGDDTYVAGWESIGYGNNSMYSPVFPNYADPQDRSGERTAYAPHATSAVFGMGLVYDHTGSDRYTAPHLTQGVGNNSGFGVLIDREGADSYTFTGIGNFSQGKGVNLGFGLLLDLSGADTGLQRTGGAGVAHVAQVDFDTRAYHKWSSADKQSNGRTFRTPYAHGYGLLLDVNVGSNPETAFQADGPGTRTAPSATLEMNEDLFFGLKVYVVIPGAFALGTVDSNTWKSNWTALVDLGGNDKYTNRAGTASLDWTSFTGASETYAMYPIGRDARGGVPYQAPCYERDRFIEDLCQIPGVPNGMIRPAVATPQSNRTGLFTPVGLAIDVDGADHYRNVGPKGAYGEGLGYGLAGIGLLYDYFNAGGQNDVYESSGKSLGVGEVFGIGAFYDERGDDRYDVGVHLDADPKSGKDKSYALGFAERGGIGVFSEPAGNDYYRGFNMSAAAIRTTFNMESATFYDAVGVDTYALGDKSQGYLESVGVRSFPSGFQAVFGAGVGECYLRSISNTVGLADPTPQTGCHPTDKVTHENEGASAILALFIDEGRDADHYASNLRDVRRPGNTGQDNNKFWNMQGTGYDVNAKKQATGAIYGQARGFDNTDFYANNQIALMWQNSNRGTIADPNGGQLSENYSGTFFPEFFVTRAVLLSPSVKLQALNDANRLAEPSHNDRIVMPQRADPLDLVWTATYGTSSILNNAIVLSRYLEDESADRFTCSVYGDYRTLGPRPSHEPDPRRPIAQDLEYCLVFDSLRDAIDKGAATATQGITDGVALLVMVRDTVLGEARNATATSPTASNDLLALAREAENLTKAHASSPYPSLLRAFDAVAYDARAAASGAGDLDTLASDESLIISALEDIRARLDLAASPAPLSLLLLASALEFEAAKNLELRALMVQYDITNEIIKAAGRSFSSDDRSDALADLAAVLQAAAQDGGNAGHHDGQSIPSTAGDGNKVRKLEVWVDRESRPWWDNTCKSDKDCFNFSPIVRCDNSNPHAPRCESRDPDGGPNATWTQGSLGCYGTAVQLAAAICKETTEKYVQRWNTTTVLANSSMRWPDASVGQPYEFVAYAWGQMNDLESEWRALATQTGNVDRADDLRHNNLWRLDDNYDYWPGILRVRAALDSTVYTNPTDLEVRHFNPTMPESKFDIKVHVSEPVQYAVDIREPGGEWLLGLQRFDSTALGLGAAGLAARNNILAFGDWIERSFRPLSPVEGAYDVRLRYVDQLHFGTDISTNPRGSFTFQIWGDSHKPVARIVELPADPEWINLGHVSAYNATTKTATYTVHFSAQDQDAYTLANGGSPIDSWTLSTKETLADCRTNPVSKTVTVAKPFANVTVRHGRCYEFSLLSTDGAGNVQETLELWRTNVDLVQPVAQPAIVTNRIHPDTPVRIPYTVESKENVYGNDVKSIEVWYNVTTNPRGPAAYTKLTEYGVESYQGSGAEHITFDLSKLRTQFNIANVSALDLNNYTAYVKIVPVDNAGNRGGWDYVNDKIVSDGVREFIVDTLAPAIVTGRPGVSPEFFQANVRFSFDEVVDPASVRIEWGLPEDFEGALCVNPARCPALVKAASKDNQSFTAVIPDLKQDRTYNFSIHAKDLVGNRAVYGPFSFQAEPVVELDFLTPRASDAVKGTVAATVRAKNFRMSPTDASTEGTVAYNYTLILDGAFERPYYLGDTKFVERRDIVNPVRTFLFDTRLVPDAATAQLVVRMTTKLNPSDPIERVSAPFAIDNSPPTVTPVFAPKRTGEWFGTKVTLSFEGVDGVAGGVVVMTSDTNRSGSFREMTGSRLFDQEGVHTVYYYGVDALGNAGNARPVSFSLDRTNPVARLLIDENARATNARQVVLQIEASDALSGVSKLDIASEGDETSLNGARLRDGFLSIPWLLPDGDGIKEVRVAVTDNAGNRIIAKDTILLDTAAPRLNPSGIVWNPISFTTASLAFETNEDATAVVLKKRVGDPSFGTPRESTVLRSTHRMVLDDLAPSQSYEVKILVSDALGNEAVYYSNVTTRTDVTPPTPPGAPAARDTGFGFMNLTWVASEDNVGVFRYSVERSADDGRTWTPAGYAYANHFLDDKVTPGKAYAYRVRAEDRAGNAGPLSGIARGVATTVPELRAGGVSPQSGALRDTFTYSVVYRDLDGDSPVYMRVRINGEVFDMVPAAVGVADYRAGVQFNYRTQLTESKLSSGMNTFVFEASDGKTIVRGPSLTEGVGPAVLSTGRAAQGGSAADESGFFGTVRNVPTPGLFPSLFAVAAIALALRRRWSA